MNKYFSRILHSQLNTQCMSLNGISDQITIAEQRKELRKYGLKEKHRI